MLRIGALKNHLHELEQDVGLMSHQLHSTKAGSEHLGTQEREMHAELVRLNKIAVDLNNRNYDLMKRKDQKDQEIHQEIARTEAAVMQHAAEQERLMRP